MPKAVSKLLHKFVSGWRITLCLGLVMFLYFGAQSAGGIGYGVVKGIDTLSWPSTNAEIGMTRYGEDHAHPSYERMEWHAHYQADGKKYNPENNSAKINIQGDLVVKGRSAKRTISAFRSGPAFIYYNPAEPSEAVLEPGVTFSPYTWTRIYGAIFGAVVAGFGYWGRARSLRTAKKASV